MSKAEIISGEDAIERVFSLIQEADDDTLAKVLALLTEAEVKVIGEDQFSISGD